MPLIAISIYEIRAWLIKPSFYLIAGVCFLIPLFLFLGTGGYFEDNTIKESHTLLFLNSPFQITSFLHYIGKFLLFLLPAIIGSTIYKDFQSGFFPLLFSYPIGKGTYLSAKFMSSFLLVCLVSAMPLLAFVSGELLLGEGNPYITSTHINGYLFSYGTILLPNLLVFGILVFSVVALFRNLYAGFLAVLFLITFQVFIENLFHNSNWLVDLLDPFGQHASLNQTRYWTVTEKNQLPLSISPILVFNRILWIGIALAFGLFTFRKFSLSHFGLDFSLYHKAAGGSRPIVKKGHQEKPFPLKLESGVKQTLLQLYTLTRHQVSYVLKHWIFITFVLMGLLLLVFMLNRILNSDDLIMLPLTRLILQIPAFFYTMLVVFATFIFSGMLMLREKDSGMEALIYSALNPTSLIIISKAISLILIQLVLLSIMMGAGIAMQTLNGYYHFDFHQYFLSIFVLQAPALAVWALLSIFVFGISRHLYLGLFILVLAWLAQFGYEQLGITSKLLQFNSHPIPAYSDFNGYGSALYGKIILQIYWLIWGILLLIFVARVWPGFIADSFKQKWALIKTRIRESMVSLGILFLPLIFIAYIIFEAESSSFMVDESKKVVSDFEEKFHSLKDIPQPRISSVSLNVELFPERRKFIATGEYILVNRSDVPIDTILVKTSLDEITDYQLEIPSQEIDSFPALNFHVFHLRSSLMPGDSIRMHFIVRSRPNTLFQKNSGVISNGTFLTQDILPRIGYFLNTTTQNTDDTYITGNHYQSWDSDLVTYNAVISTSDDQIAFTNGRLKDHWQQDERNYFSYKTSKKVKFNFHFNSGRFDTYTEFWKDTPITIYHHPAHTHNLKSIATGVKAALEFNHKLFGNTPDGKINVIEYPLTEGSFSTLKTNTIIMSESIFGINTHQTEKINLPFYVAAHEMTHHWFGNQIIPKDAPGALFLTESITEYLTLQIFKEKFGNDAALNFLKVQHQRYFRGRANEQGEENPLLLVESGQDYISYGKGAVALNAIAHKLGPDSFHSFLSDFFVQYSSAEGYPTALDFFHKLERITNNSSCNTIEELLLKSITYSAYIKSAEVLEKEKNSWVISVNYSIKVNGQNEPLVIAEPGSVELGIYDEMGELIHLLPVFENENTIKIELKSKPYRLVLDPNYLILDRERNDNSFNLN